MKPILIIPCFNDNIHLKTLLKSEYLINKEIDIIVVDDGSVPKVSNLEASIVLLRNEQNKGKGFSLKRALDYAKKNQYTHAIALDADLQHDPIYIDDFIKADSDINLVIGARNFSKKMPFLRRFSNKVTSFMISAIVGKKILDSQSGYRRYKLSSDSFCNCTEEGFQFESEILINELRRKESSLTHVPISTLYHDEKSSINNIVDTYKFIKLIMRKIIDR